MGVKLVAHIERGT